MRIIDRGADGVVRPVLWTRGQGCRELAEALSEVEPIRVIGEVGEACIRHGAELLISRRFSSSFDLVNTAVPVDFDPTAMSTVVAAVAGGPHSELAVRVAERIGEATGVDALVTCAFQQDEDKATAAKTIEWLSGKIPGIEYRLVKAADATDLVGHLPERAMLVIGAPGGGWLVRTFFGPGAKLKAEAPSGAVVVRRSPVRVFQVMTDPLFVGPLREAVDILRVHNEPVLAVVDRAQLIGIVRRSALEIADPGVPVEALMEEPTSILLTAAVEEAHDLFVRFRGGSIPVVDTDGRLVGALPTSSMIHPD